MKYVYNKFIGTLCCKRTILHSKGCSCVDNDSLDSYIKHTLLNWWKTRIILWKVFTKEDETNPLSKVMLIMVCTEGRWHQNEGKVVDYLINIMHRI